jgi:hypothetical protein
VTRRVAIPFFAALAGFGGRCSLRAQARVAAHQQAEPIQPIPPERQPSIGCRSDPTPVAGVPHPCAYNKLIPDFHTAAWANLGQRTVRGIVYHRQFGTMDGSDEYLRNVPSPGPSPCEGHESDANFGGCVGLQDYGVDHQSGAIYWWNDPTGASHPQTDSDLNVSANRAGFANGEVQGQTAAVQAFIDDEGGDVHLVNRDLVSISIDGFAEDPISDACLNAVAALSAHYANLARIPWDSYPAVPNKKYGFVFLHNEINANTPCPGAELTNRIPEIVSLTSEILRNAQAVR